MFTSGNGNPPEVHHLADWSTLDWFLRLVFEAVLPALVFAVLGIICIFAVDLRDAAKEKAQNYQSGIGTRLLPGTITAAACLSVGGIALLGFYWYATNFLNILRHTTTYGWSFVTAMFLVAFPLAIIIAARIYLRDTFDSKYLNWTAIGLGGLFFANAAGLFLIDGLIRVAAGIPTDLVTLLKFLLGIAFCLILAAIFAFLEKSNQRN